MISISASERGESPWAVVATVATVIAAVAAVAVFVIPPAESHSDVGSSTSPTAVGRSESSIAPTPVTSGETPTGSDGRETRLLSALAPETGAGLIQVKGSDIAVPCPSNQSDDRVREVSYDLPATFAELSAQVAVTGKADQDATAAVQVFIQRRQDRSDRITEVGRSIIGQKATNTLAVALSNAVALTLRVSCVSPDQTVHLVAPRVIR